MGIQLEEEVNIEVPEKVMGISIDDEWLTINFIFLFFIF